MKQSLDRRALLKAGSALGFSSVAMCGVAKAIETPPQTEGPFYPIEDQRDKDQDMTTVPGRSGTAEGEVVTIFGTVKDRDDNPLSGALIDVWQACASGRYDHPGASTEEEFDPNFQYWARLMTDYDGKFRFKTVVPGPYPVGGRYRAPHIHFRIDAWGHDRLTTQMYFKGEELNDRDGILVRVERDYGAEGRAMVEVDFDSMTDDDGNRMGEFNIVLGTTAKQD